MERVHKKHNEIALHSYRSVQSIQNTMIIIDGNWDIIALDVTVTTAPMGAQSIIILI